MSIGSSLGLTATRIVEPVEGVHRAVSNRVMSMIGPLRRPVEPIHDAVTGTVYWSIRAGSLALGAGLDATPWARSRVAADTAGVVTGLWGDDLGSFERRLTIPIGFRDGVGSLVPSDRLSDTFPDAGGRVVVLVHGWAQTERCWEDRGTVAGLKSAIGRASTAEVLAVRYNSGLRVSANGAALSALLEDMCKEWATPIESISLVGHSMGGLVLRAACLEATGRGHRWISQVDQLITLGTPHLGAPAEKAVNVVAWALSRVAASRPLADWLNGRSAGVKDLRYGAVADVDWAGLDPDALLSGALADHPMPEHVTLRFVAGVVTDDPEHPVGVVMGDLLVRRASAGGGRKLIPHDLTVLGGITHLDLLRRPEVVDRVVAWLAPGQVGAGGS